METLFLSNWQHEKNGMRLSDPLKMEQVQGGDEVRLPKGEMEQKRGGIKDRQQWRGSRRGVPTYKRRRLRGGATMPGRQKDPEMEM